MAANPQPITRQERDELMALAGALIVANAARIALSPKKRHALLAQIVAAADVARARCRPDYKVVTLTTREAWAERDERQEILTRAVEILERVLSAELNPTQNRCG